MPNLIPGVRPQAHDELLHLRRMTASERVALGTHWQAVREAMHAAKTVRNDVIRLPRPPGSTSTHVTRAGCLPKDFGTLAPGRRSPWRWISMAL